MKREEIEQLLADYASGEISAINRQRLEELFKQDAALKEEADKMATVWQSLNEMEQQPGAEADKQFYAMLQNAKADQRQAGRVVQLNVGWLKAAAAIAACIMAFVIGRYTVAPAEIVKYKMVVVKQPAVNIQQINKPETVIAKAHAGKQVTEETSNEGSPLARQLRSVFASERIDAVVKLSAKKNLNAADLKMLEMALSEDPNPNVRLMVVNSLRPLLSKQNVQQVLINSLDRQGDVMVQTSIVDMLVAAKSKQAIPQMITLLDNKNTDAMVQNKIKDGIETFLN